MDPPLRALVSAWLDTHASTNTQAAYRRDVDAFVQWCDATGRDPVASRPDDLDRYRDDCLAEGVSTATVSRRLSALASFFRYATDAGVVGENPVATVERPSLKRRSDTPVLDDAEMTSLVEAAQSLGPKTATLVGLLALDGMKLGEVLSLDVDAIHLGRKSARVEVERRGERRQLTLAPITAEAMASHVGSRRDGPLFLGEGRADPPTRLTRFGAAFLIKRAGSTAGLNRPISANVLRRSYIEAAHRAGSSLESIAAQVGHRDVRETARMLEDRG